MRNFQWNSSQYSSWMNEWKIGCKDKGSFQVDSFGILRKFYYVGNYVSMPCSLETAIVCFVYRLPPWTNLRVMVEKNYFLKRGTEKCPFVKKNMVCNLRKSSKTHSFLTYSHSKRISYFFRKPHKLYCATNIFVLSNEHGTKILYLWCFIELELTCFIGIN